jgi:glycosyltransferase involved in cell wall biosynthesis
MHRRNVDELPKEGLIMQDWKSSEILVSVTCISYNHAAFIEDALKGFLMQETDFAFEIIMFDDASTDTTQDIIRKYAALYPNIIKPMLQAENLWLGKGINGTTTVAWPAAKGKYIAWCEGDDYWTDPLKLQKQVSFLEKNPSFAGATHYTEEKSGKETRRIMGAQFGSVLDTPKTFVKLSPIHTSSFIFKKDALEIPVWYNTVFSCDMALFSIISKSGPIYCFQEVMSHYRVHEGGITRSKRNHYVFHKQRQHLIKCLNAFHEYKYNEIAQELIQHHKRMKYHGQNHYIGYLIWKCKDFTKKGMNRIGKIAGIKTVS